VGCERNIERYGMKLLSHLMHLKDPHQILRASCLDPSSFPAGYQQNNDLIREFVAVETHGAMRDKKIA